MNEQKITPQITHPEEEENLLLLSEVHKTPEVTQRELSLRLNMSLGKTNYLIRQLMKKGLLKVRNFSYNPGKMGKMRYYLTKRGLEHKLHLAYHFLKKKEAEYNRMKEEWEHLRAANDLKEPVLEERGDL